VHKRHNYSYINIQHKRYHHQIHPLSRNAKDNYGCAGEVAVTMSTRSIAAFLWAREVVFTRNKLLVFTISQEESQHQKHGVRWRKWATGRGTQNADY